METGSRTELCSVIPGFLRGARAFAREANIHLTVLAVYQGEDFGQIGSHFLSGEGLLPEGLILMGPGLCRNSESVVQALKRNIPTVVLCRNWPDMPISTVGHDHYEQAGIALSHLIHLGHRTIAFLGRKGDERHDWHQRRLDCYRNTLADLNGGIDEGLIVLAEDGVSAAKTLMSRRPDVTAILANHDARQAPEGFPGLTTVHFSHFEVGYLAAELLLRRVENRAIVRGNIWMRSHLVERESCCRPRRA